MRSTQFLHTQSESVNRKAVHLSIDLPWPISERELLIFGYSADDLDGMVSLR